MSPFCRALKQKYGLNLKQAGLSRATLELSFSSPKKVLCQKMLGTINVWSKNMLSPSLGPIHFLVYTKMLVQNVLVQKCVVQNSFSSKINLQSQTKFSPTIMRCKTMLVQIKNGSNKILNLKKWRNCARWMTDISMESLFVMGNGSAVNWHIRKVQELSKPKLTTI